MNFVINLFLYYILTYFTASVFHVAAATTLQKRKVCLVIAGE